MSSAVMYKSATNRTSKGTRKASEAEKITETYNSYKVKTRGRCDQGRGPSREGRVEVCYRGLQTKTVVHVATLFETRSLALSP